MHRRQWAGGHHLVDIRFSSALTRSRTIALAAGDQPVALLIGVGRSRLNQRTQLTNLGLFDLWRTRIVTYWSGLIGSPTH